MNDTGFLELRLRFNLKTLFAAIVLVAIGFLSYLEYQKALGRARLRQIRIGFLWWAGSADNTHGAP